MSADYDQAVTEQKIYFSSEGVTLSGTLTFPSRQDRYPALILLSGSGPETRDFYGKMPFAKSLSHHFCGLGFAVFRYDDRGVGDSEGDYWTTTVIDHATDALGALQALSNHPNVDPRRIGMLGHSFGTIVGISAASKSTDVRFLVLLAAPALDGVTFQVEQLVFQGKKAGLGESEIEEQRKLLTLVFESVRDGGDYDDVTQALRSGQKGHFSAESVESTIEALRQRFPPPNPWVRSFLKQKPAETVKTLAIPVLAVYGELDHQAPAQLNSQAMRAIKRANSKLDLTVVIWPRANHAFQAANTGGREEWSSLALQFAPDLLPFLGDWVVRHVS